MIETYPWKGLCWGLVDVREEFGKVLVGICWGFKSSFVGFRKSLGCDCDINCHNYNKTLSILSLERVLGGDSDKCLGVVWFWFGSGNDFGC